MPRTVPAPFEGVVVPRDGQVSVTMAESVVDDVREALEAGVLRGFAVRSVPHALELGARRLLEDARGKQGA